MVFRCSRHRVVRPSHRFFHPRLEPLEDRRVPSLFTVTNTEDSGSGSLRQAVLDANAHAGPNLIIFSSDVSGTIALTSGPLSFTGELVIAGPGADSLAVSGSDTSRVFEVASGASVGIAELAITHGLATQGAGIDNAGLLSLYDVALSDNQALNNNGDGQGGAIFNQAGAALFVSHTTLSNNLAFGNPGPVLPPLPGGKGGAIYNEGDAVLDSSTLSGNQAEGAGGGFSIGARGGAIWNGTANPPTGSAATLTITNSTFSSNQAFGDAGSTGAYGGRALGGALFNRYGTISVSQSTFNGNQALAGPSGNGIGGNFGGGGAIANTTAGGNLTSTITIDQSSFSGNQTIGGAGGAGYAGGNGDGGVIYNESILALSASILSGNQATGGAGGSGGLAGPFNGSGLGGAIANSQVAQTGISHCMLNTNVALGGAGITLENGGPASGGALYSESVTTLTLDYTRLMSNQAIGGAGGTSGQGGPAFGGGLSEVGNTMLTVTIGAFMGNEAQGGAGGDGRNGGNASGGGLYFSGGTSTLDGARVTGNLAQGGAGGMGGQDGQGVGGGVYIGTGTVHAPAVHVAKNHASTSNDDLFGMFTGPGG
jgi:hypothetical protein